MKLFELKDISFSYRNGGKALDHVSLSVDEGESLAVIGTNGSGKSTLLYILDGLLKPEEGQLWVFGTRMHDEFPVSFRQKVSLLFQNSQAQLFSLSVWDELCFGPLQLGMNTADAGERAEGILRMLGIGHLKERGPWDLSGGEMKKVAMGACLSTAPDVLLLDEPTSGLDPKSQVEIVELIQGLKKAGKTIVTATHDLHIIEDISERVVVLDENHRVLLEGRPWEVLDNHDALLQANLIHRHAHRHCWYVHEHSHYSAHEHEHIKEGEEFLKEEKTVDEMEKLKKLLAHWHEHNSEHAETYREWAGKAEAMGRADIALLLREMAEKTSLFEGLFRKAKEAF